MSKDLIDFLSKNKEEQRNIKIKALNSSEIREDGPHSSNLYIKLPEALEDLYDYLEYRVRNGGEIKDYILGEISNNENTIKDDKEVLKRERLGLISRVALTVRVNILREEISEYKKVLDFIKE